MSDRFRFRIWDNEFKKYRTGLGINNGLVCTYNDDTCVLEQCTGLKDKNGKLIYENDIVDLDDSETYATIEWGEQDGCWRIVTIENNIYTFDNLYGYELAVCGNIHENADLFEVKE